MPKRGLALGRKTQCLKLILEEVVRFADVMGYGSRSHSAREPQGLAVAPSQRIEARRVRRPELADLSAMIATLAVAAVRCRDFGCRASAIVDMLNAWLLKYFGTAKEDARSAFAPLRCS